MKAFLNVGPLQFEVEAKSQKEMFKSLAEIQEVFAEDRCGLCGENNLKFSVRLVKDDNEYYEMVCLNCGGKLSFGQTKKGEKLFPIRKVTDDGKPDRKEGKWGKHRGWYKFVKNNKLEEEKDNDDVF